MAWKKPFYMICQARINPFFLYHTSINKPIHVWMNFSKKKKEMILEWFLHEFDQEKIYPDKILQEVDFGFFCI